MIRRILTIASAMILAAGAAGCSSSQATSAPATAAPATAVVTPATSAAPVSTTGGTGKSKGALIAYFAPSLGISYWQWVGWGVEGRAKELGMTYVEYNADNDQGKQLANMNTAITAGVKGIVIGPVSSTSVPALLDLAAQNNIPVAFAGIGPPPGTTNYTSMVTANNEESGKKEATFLCDKAKALGGNKVGMLSLPQDRENAQKYLKGAQAGFAAGGCELVQILQTTGLTVNEAVQETQDLLTAHPDIKAIYGMYDEAGTGAAQVLADRGLTGKIAVATADGSPTTVQLVRDGKLDALFVQEAAGQGIDATTQIYNSLEGFPVTQQIFLVEPMLTKDNIDTPDGKKALSRVFPPQ
jgi:ribose transport system substrate-binding protein